MNLMQHAKRELDIAGFDEKSNDVSGKIARSVIKLLRALDKQGLDEFELEWVLKTFGRLAIKSNLTPLTNNHVDWVNVSNYMGIDTVIYQSLRNQRCYTTDFVTYFDTADKTNYIETADGIFLKPLGELVKIPLKEDESVST